MLRQSPPKRSHCHRRQHIWEQSVGFMLCSDQVLSPSLHTVKCQIKQKSLQHKGVWEVWEQRDWKSHGTLGVRLKCERISSMKLVSVMHMSTSRDGAEQGGFEALGTPTNFVLANKIPFLLPFHMLLWAAVEEYHHPTHYFHQNILTNYRLLYQFVILWVFAEKHSELMNYLKQMQYISENEFD